MPALTPVEQLRALLAYDKASGFLDGLSEEARCMALAYIMRSHGHEVYLLGCGVSLLSPKLLQSHAIKSCFSTCYALEVDEGGHCPVFVGAFGEDDHLAAEEAFILRLGGDGAVRQSEHTRAGWLAQRAVPLDTWRPGQPLAGCEVEQMRQIVELGKTVLDAALLTTDLPVPTAYRSSPRL